MKFFLSILFFSLSLNAQELWIPSRVQVSPSGDVSHKFPFPTTADPGAAFKEITPRIASFFPTIGGDLTNFQRIFALSGGEPVNAEIKETQSGLFLPPNDRAGYRSIDTKNVSVNLSLATSAAMVGGWAGIGIDFGVSGSYSKGYLASRFAPTLEAAEKLPMVTNIPKNIEEIKKGWNPGDSLSVNRTMGVGIDAGIGSKSYFKVGVLARIDSTWSVTLGFPDRLANPKGLPLVSLTITRKKDKKFTVVGNNLLGDLSWEKIWGKSESFNYIFDLSNSQKTDLELEEHLDPKNIKKANLKNINALLAYQEALKGNLFLADGLHKLKSFGVQKVSMENKKDQSSKIGAGFSIPFLFRATYKQGKSYSRGKVQKIGDNLLVENVLSFYSQESGTNGIISADMKRLSMFSGNFQQVTPLMELDGLLQRRYSGNYKYFYTTNRATDQDLYEELKKLRYRVGFMKEIKQFEKVPPKIGSLEIGLDISISNVATDELMKLAEKFPPEAFENEALAYINGFFENVKDAKSEICTNYKMRILQECIFTTKRQTKAAMQAAYRALLDMKKHRLSHDYKQFVSAFADFGRGFIENRFTMKTFLRMLRYEFFEGVTGKDKFGPVRYVKDKDGRPMKIPYEIVLTIKGTNFTPYEKVLYSWKDKE